MPARDSERAKSNASTLKSVTEEAQKQTPSAATPATIVQRTGLDPRSLSARDVLQLQRAFGNRAVTGVLGGTTLQRKAGEEEERAKTAPNRTGMPDGLKSGIESLSGMSMDNVKVHYNSDKPAQVQALAYAQGSDIHIGPGQESHLPHEAWHVVQQKQGRVKPTMQLGSTPINDDGGLEAEATSMGSKALQRQSIEDDDK